MTDEEYFVLLRALAAKHLRIEFSIDQLARIRFELERISSTARLLKLLQLELLSRKVDVRRFSEAVHAELVSGPPPVEEAGRFMEETGLLDALDEAPSLVLGQLRKTAIPTADVELLRHAGYTDSDIEVFLAISLGLARDPALYTQAAGTIVAPNPATSYGVIASGGLALSGLFAGLGDLRGE